MGRLDRYLYLHLLQLFGLFGLVLVGVYWVNRAVVLFDQLIGDGQSALVFLEFSALTLPNVIRMVLPIAAFAATVYATNRLTGDSELVVLQATGFSPLRLARPVVVFGLTVTLMMLILTNILVPQSRQILNERKAALSQSVSAQFLRPGQFLHPSDGVTVFVGAMSDQGELQDILLSDLRDPARQIDYTARRALFIRSGGGPRLIMIDGQIAETDAASGRLFLTRFEDFTYDLGLTLTGTASTKRSSGELSTPDLLWPDDAVRAEVRASDEKMRHEGNVRLADPFLALGAALIGFGALLQGSFSRFGLMRQVGLAVVLMVGVQGISTATLGLGTSAPLGWVLAWAAPVMAVALGLALILHSGRRRRSIPRPADAVAA